MEVGHPTLVINVEALIFFLEFVFVVAILRDKTENAIHPNVSCRHGSREPNVRVGGVPAPLLSRLLRCYSQHFSKGYI